MTGEVGNEGHRFNQSRGTNMKQTRLVKILTIAVACVATLGIARAQETTTTTTTADPVTGTTIVTYTPDSDYFMFRTAPNVAPTRYYYTRDTAIVDPEGRTVSWSAIRPDMPATIYYSTVGDRVLVRKVVLSRPPAVIKHEETTTTTTTRP